MSKAARNGLLWFVVAAIPAALIMWCLGSSLPAAIVGLWSAACYHLGFYFGTTNTEATRMVDGEEK